MDLMLRTGPFAVAASILLAQPAAHQDIRLIDAGRPLTASEIGTVLSLSQKAVSGKTFRLTAMGASQSPTEVVMGSGGQPRTMRSTNSRRRGRRNERNHRDSLAARLRSNHALHWPACSPVW
jgi:hypothetical protein